MRRAEHPLCFQEARAAKFTGATIVHILAIKMKRGKVRSFSLKSLHRTQHDFIELGVSFCTKHKFSFIPYYLFRKLDDIDASCATFGRLANDDPTGVNTDSGSRNIAFSTFLRRPTPCKTSTLFMQDNGVAVVKAL